MCLAIPGKILEIKSDKMAKVDFGGITRDASLDLVPSAKVGNYVLVHAGWAIEIVDEAEALATLKLADELRDLTQSA